MEVQCCPIHVGQLKMFTCLCPVVYRDLCAALPCLKDDGLETDNYAGQQAKFDDDGKMFCVPGSLPF